MADATGFSSTAYGAPGSLMTAHAVGGELPALFSVPSLQLNASPITTEFVTGAKYFADDTFAAAPFDATRLAGSSVDPALTWSAFYPSGHLILSDGAVIGDGTTAGAVSQFAALEGFLEPTAGEVVIDFACKRVAAFNPTNFSTTIKLWYTPDNWATWQGYIVIVGHGTNTGGGTKYAQFEYDSSSAWDSGTFPTASIPTVAVGEAVSYRLHLNGTSLALYINGTLLGAVAGPAPIMGLSDFQVQSAYGLVGATVYIPGGVQVAGVATLGVPSSPLDAFGFSSGQLGSPARGVTCSAASAGVITQIPQAYYAFNQWELAAPAHTDSDTSIGSPWAPPPVLPSSRNGWARGFCATTTGSPSSLAPVSAQEIGWVEELLGTPTSGQSYAAGGFGTANVGEPVSSGLAGAAGFKATTFGAPSNARVQPAAALHRPTRWGLPKPDILGTCKARGFYTVRWAQPTARTGNLRPATALHAPAQFGTPEARNTFRGLHLSPVVRFGRHLMRRNTTC